MSQRPDPDTPETAASASRGRRGLVGAVVDSLPGQLLMVTIGVIAIGVALVYFPAAAGFRLQWMTDRAEAAHLAALAADVAPDGALGEDEVRALLMGADAVAVSRVRDGMNELVLYSGPIGEGFVESDLRKANWATHLRDTVDVLFAPPGRLLRIRAEPAGYPDELIDVIVHEAPLRRELQAFSRRFLLYSAVAAFLLGIVLYAALYLCFVRPMRRFAAAMNRFRADPSDPGRMVHPSGSRTEIGEAEQELARMQAEIRQALQQRERLATLGGAVAKINHDLRNVLASAQLVSDRLAADSDERVRRMGERLVRAVDRGVRLCEATLEFGRAEERPPTRRAVPLRALLDEVANDALPQDSGVVCENSVAPDLVVLVDPDHVHRIVFNLCRNAVQAMMTVDEPRRLTAGAVREGDAVHIEIADTGPGLPPKARANLFSPFTGSARKGGTGLGLSIARELARANGGDVELAHSDAEGTTFRITLPAVPQEERGGEA